MGLSGDTIYYNGEDTRGAKYLGWNPGFGCGLVKSETPFRTLGGDIQEADGLMSLELRKEAERGWS